MSPIESALVLLVLLLILLYGYLFYEMQKNKEAITWIFQNVRIIPADDDDSDPDYNRIRKLFGIEEEEEPGK